MELVDVKSYLHFFTVGFICALLIQLKFCESIKEKQYEHMICMLYNTCYLIYNTCHVMLYNTGYVMLHNRWYVMLYNTRYVMLYDTCYVI